ncbi:hypothetical protein PIB30_028255 [Stylosanthes scabra]|uniref:Uncharacterized protein n=1 Tax=Stylosanthes scabra TaxID=79078 RepID=A0ABU6VAE1_9FABA|nr:hypothetical protein [Stylosanthes scabra]
MAMSLALRWLKDPIESFYQLWIVEQAVRQGAVHTQGRRYAKEHVEHAVQGASVFHQGLMETEKCVEGVTLTWLLMATNPSAPRYFTLHANVSNPLLLLLL